MHISGFPVPAGTYIYSSGCVPPVARYSIDCVKSKQRRASWINRSSSDGTVLFITWMVCNLFYSDIIRRTWNPEFAVKGTSINELCVFWKISLSCNVVIKISKTVRDLNRTRYFSRCTHCNVLSAAGRYLKVVAEWALVLPEIMKSEDTQGIKYAEVKETQGGRGRITRYIATGCLVLNRKWGRIVCWSLLSGSPSITPRFLSHSHPHVSLSSLYIFHSFSISLSWM